MHVYQLISPSAFLQLGDSSTPARTAATSAGHDDSMSHLRGSPGFIRPISGSPRRWSDSRGWRDVSDGISLTSVVSPRYTKKVMGSFTIHRTPRRGRRPVGRESLT